MIIENFPLIVALIAILVAQVVKIPIAYLMKSDRLSLKLAFSTGGMPSSHSAGVSALITSLVLHYGIQSPYAAIAITFGVIVMYDSMAVRRQAGEQGIVLEKLIHELQQNQTVTNLTFKDPDDDDQLTLDEMVVNKYLGHKPNEVFAGVFTGIFTAILADVISRSFF